MFPFVVSFFRLFLETFEREVYIYLSFFAWLLWKGLRLCEAPKALLRLGSCDFRTMFISL